MGGLSVGPGVATMFGRTFRTVGVLIVAVAVAAGFVAGGVGSCSAPDQPRAATSVSR